MKKFSKYTKSPVGEEVKEIVKVSEEDLMKSKILKLMDNFLSIQMYGPVTRYAVAGTMKVSGKEIFLEALMDLLKGKKIDSEIRILESLKSEILDWETLDRKIEESKSKNIETYTQKMYLESLSDRWKDEEIILERITSGIDKLSKEEMVSRIEACNELEGEVYSKISKIYKDRLDSI